MAYWTVVIDGENFALNLKFLFLGIGILLTAAQLFFGKILYERFGKEVVLSSQNPDEVDFIRNDLLSTILVSVFLVYASITFYFMWVGAKSEIIWLLISLDLIGILYLSFSVGSVLKKLAQRQFKNYNLLFYRR